MEKSAAVFGLVMICSSFWFKRTELTHTKATKATPGACAPSTHHTHTNTLARSLCMLMRQGTFDGSKHTAEPVRHPEGGGFKKKKKKRICSRYCRDCGKITMVVTFFIIYELFNNFCRELRSLLPHWHHGSYVVVRAVATSLY